jgi:hypothetical protein
MERSERTPAPSNPGDFAYGTFYSGAVGGCAVALVFLAADVMAGRPLFTPSLLGGVLFFGQSAAEVTDVNLTAVALFTLVHFAAFGVLGILATVLFRGVMGRNLGPSVLTAIMLFALMQGGFMVASRTLLPGVMAALGAATVITANVLTALAMSLFLKATLTPRAEEEDEHEEDLVEGPALT